MLQSLRVWTASKIPGAVPAGLPHPPSIRLGFIKTEDLLILGEIAGSGGLGWAGGWYLVYFISLAGMGMGSRYIVL